MKVVLFNEMEVTPRRANSRKIKWLPRGEGVSRRSFFVFKFFNDVHVLLLFF